MAKHSNTDPQVSNLSLLNTSLSQDLDTADSLSIPSEPPEIRNWFSSYVYESPELDTVGDLLGYGFGDSGCVEEKFEGEENLGKFRKIRNKEELVLGEKVASVGHVKSNNTDENQNLGNPNSIQVGGSSDSLSLSSEPPHLARWFSSYAYESPALDTSDDFKGSVFTESECEGVGGNAENCSKEKRENSTDFRATRSDVLASDEKMSSNGLVKCKSLDGDNKYDNQHNSKGIHVVEGKMSSVLIEMPVKTIPGLFLEGKPTRNSDYGSTSTQSGEKPSLDAQVSIRKDGNNRESDVMCLNPNASRGWNNRKSPAKSTDRRDSAEVRKPTCGSNGKENDRKIFPENGFVSTRSNRSARPNDGSSLKRSGEGHFGGLRNRVTDSSVVGKEGILRKPFLETTNFRHNESLEITGKWKCPQKSKPNLGPPLKQLRLEQWVHRV
ncbi:Dentin sialoprotein [Actinidia chinensis var. chinensis]|uniref:Dentin sialoprotein n=1 Tax=Actinidia chinensis var. chinensis TaxID=1590841 RepID=A0A2R6QJV9_ACTCC|nr:Dentin sialoprotein [Actinidia chinensis var. chinensis]